LNPRIVSIIQAVGSPRIAVVGDLILDSYIMGEANRISPEAPIQVLEVGGESHNLGGAANVAANLKTLGVAVECCGVVGDDAEGARLIAMLEERGIGTAAVIVDENRPTVRKTRVVSHNQQLLRIDRETTRPLDDGTAEKLFKSAERLLAESDAVIVSDYAKGTLTPWLLEGIMKSAGGFGVLVDPKGREFGKYRGARLITPNKKEAEDFTGLSIGNEDALDEASSILRAEVGVRETVITLGPKGIYFSDRPDRSEVIPAQTRSVYDVTGAGDTVIAILALFLADGNSLQDAVRIANAGAGIVVGRLGVSAPTRRELLRAFSRSTGRPAEKILNADVAAELSRKMRAGGEKLVFTNGCFDLIHGGHLDFLRTARSFGDALMVAVNDDQSVRRLKGDSRPVLELDERQEILASLHFVDYVVAFSEDTPEKIIRQVTPGILVKGKDWEDKGVVGREWVEKEGGEVKLIELRPGRSTTNIIRRILELNRKADNE